ncbi:coagulation factor XIII B chain-like isoform X2 [Brachyhypopomus gauderio]|uniref:coagulation factor XIII B chain-like isoform X2 n=2 Tax=Brachyhypopomus gauderio TaxID=698409 RepID=UPI0040413BA2
MRIIILLLCICSSQAEKVLKKCLPPTIPHGFLVPENDIYEHGAIVFYGCGKDLKPAIKTWVPEFKCDDGKWSHNPECIPKSACIATEVSHAQLQDEFNRWYPNNTRVQYVCDKGYESKKVVSATCTDGKWTLPVCTRHIYACGPPDLVDNGVVLTPYKDVFGNGEIVKFACKNGYKMDGIAYKTCNKGTWTHVQCELERATLEIAKPTQRPSLPGGDHKIPTHSGSGSSVSLCGPYPSIKNGDMFEQPDGFALKVQCASLYKLEGPDEVMCVNKEWTAVPICKEPCKLDQKLFYYDQPEYIQHGVVRNEYCARPNSWKNLYVKCNNGRALYRGCGHKDWVNT